MYNPMQNPVIKEMALAAAKAGKKLDIKEALKKVRKPWKNLKATPLTEAEKKLLQRASQSSGKVTAIKQPKRVPRQISKQTGKRVDGIVKASKNISKTNFKTKAARWLRKAARGTKTSATKIPTGTNLLKLGIVGAAATYGAHRIQQAKKSAIKEIKSQHSPERMRAHRRSILAIRAQRGQKKTTVKSDTVKSTKSKTTQTPKTETIKSKAATALRKTSVQSKPTVSPAKKPVVKNMATIWNPNKPGSKQIWKIGKPMPSKGFQLWRGGRASGETARAHIKTEAPGRALAIKRKLTWSALNKIDKASLIKQAQKK